ncbi:MAG TPA: kelch repeat-containing protein [Thermoanaerobaculia bacterium]|nr:kelch repeat-containing protein [Thermoanaerobaculia bacterium]
MPTARSGIAAAVVEGRIYVFGGEGNPSTATGVFAENESFDVATGTWRSEVPMVNPRHGIGAAAIGDRIHIPAGAPTQGFGLSSVHDAFVPRMPKRRAVRADKMSPPMSDEKEVRRFDLLSRSESGLSFVRERRGGVMRVLTESELADFDDPKPCPECAEQFGCEHFNCAGEAMLSDAEIETDVVETWRPFAKEVGVSRQDLLRLREIEEREGEYRVADGATSDVRMLELVLLLNEAR